MTALKDLWRVVKTNVFISGLGLGTAIILLTDYSIGIRGDFDLYMAIILIAMVFVSIHYSLEKKELNDKPQ